MNQLTLEKLNLKPNDYILEIGFGGGALLEMILLKEKGIKLAGLDLSQEMISAAQRRLGTELDLKQGDVEKIPYPNNHFTKICSVNTLYFWKNPNLALKECHRVLKPDGLLVICFNSKEDLTQWPAHRHGFQLYTIEEATRLFENAGFHQVASHNAQDPSQGLIHLVTGIK